MENRIKEYTTTPKNEKKIVNPSTISLPKDSDQHEVSMENKEYDIASLKKIIDTPKGEVDDKIRKINHPTHEPITEQMKYKEVEELRK